MSIIINQDTKVLIQGVTGNEGVFHTRLMLDYGTNIVAGVTPGKYGEKVHGVPVYDTVQQALENHEVGATGVFVPGLLAKNAALEAIDGGIKAVVVVTEGVPLHDAMVIKSEAVEKGVIVIGPNTPGVVSVDQCKLGILDTHHVKTGNIGVVSRSGTLTTEITASLVEEGLGQSTVVGIGGDGVVGSTFLDIYKMFENDPDTVGVAFVGEIGGTMEEELAAYIGNRKTKPAVAFIAGQNVPEGKRLGHAGAIVEGSRGTAESKIKALTEAGVRVGAVPWDLGKLMKEMIREG
jgi:succinyl-CoA synthetase alpha subunit